MSKLSQEDKPEKSTGVQPVPFGDLKIDPNKRLPAMDQGGAKAYAASDSKADPMRYFALVCQRHLVPRHHSRETYNSIITTRLAKLFKSGVVRWVPADEERFVFVYERIQGEPLIEKGQPFAGEMRSEDVLQHVVPFMVDILQDFRDRDFVHGSIRPDNIFQHFSDGRMDSFVLGDCLAAPASYNQPILFETISRSKADPIGRGLGTRADDMYAFGMLLAVLLRKTDPFSKMNSDDLIRLKMNDGSFATITSKERFHGTILELLRGLLHDDEGLRWTIDDVLVWLEGRRLQPKQGKKQHKAARPLVYCKQKYLYPTFLAMDIDVNPAETQRLVESEELEQWVERSLEDSETLERLQIGLKSARERGTGTGYEDRLVANVSTALDPDAPLRYRGLRLMAGATGKSLAEVMILKQDVKPFVDMFAQNIMLTWIGAQISSNFDFGSLISNFDECRMFVGQQKIGYGIERCLYVLCKEAFCLSPKLEGYYALSPEDMVFAFEDLCAKGQSPSSFLDRHSIAFLAVRDRKLLEKSIYDLDSNEPRKRILAELRTLAMIQRREILPAFPALAKVFHKNLICVYSCIKDKKVRKKTEKTMDDLAAKGNLSKMVDTIADGNLFKSDTHGFSKARSEYHSLQQEYNELEIGLQNQKVFGKKEARGYAVVVSAIVSGLSILVLLLLFIRGVLF